MKKNLLHLRQEELISLKQGQRLMLSASMQQALHVLQMPLLELTEWLKIEVEQNPVLEFQDECTEEESPLGCSEEKEIDFEKSQFEVIEYLDESFEKGLFFEGKEWSQQHTEKKFSKENFLSYGKSLFEHLMEQAKLNFHTQKELLFAEQIIGNLDERGFLVIPLDQLEGLDNREEKEALLKKIQAFDPPGIAALHLKDSLLIQLRLKGKQDSLAYSLIEHHFEDLIHNRLPLLVKKLKCSPSALRLLIEQDLAPLDLHPAYRFHSEPSPPIVPDITIKKEGEQWILDTQEDFLPSFRITPAYLREKDLNLKEKEFIRYHLTSATWLLRNLQERHKTLKEITKYVIQKQTDFFSGLRKELLPMTMQEIAASLGLHESTIARAVSHKYLFSPQGLHPLRHFFSHALATSSGSQVSAHTAKDLLIKLIETEDKKHPLSDQALSDKIQELGISCSRRTVTKYRQLLHIVSASQRRTWSL